MKKSATSATTEKNELKIAERQHSITLLPVEEKANNSSEDEESKSS